jgi:hypothetical protein
MIDLVSIQYCKDQIESILALGKTTCSHWSLMDCQLGSLHTARHSNYLVRTDFFELLGCVK